jgi:hypothetical protein
VKRRRHPRLAELRVRLTRLRGASSRLATRAGLGRQLRQLLTEAGSPIWKPAEDLSWRTWIESQGDEYARAILAAADELLQEMAARATAAEEEARKGS